METTDSGAAVAAGCPAAVRAPVCVSAKVTVTPHVAAGPVKCECAGAAVLGACPGENRIQGGCSFTVHRRICVTVPLTFSAGARAAMRGAVCGVPAQGGCSGAGGCTFTVGYYRNHPDVTRSLIEAAGGAVILGSGTAGASFTVTPGNAQDVLSFATPSPPAPASAPRRQQYLSLYAQLLTADLNIISGAGCARALEAAEAANEFLAASEPGVGMNGADELQKPLAGYNEGSAPGCPGHCGQRAAALPRRSEII